jgi:hypothetical protein
LSNLGLERFFMELVRILTRSMIQKSLWHQHRSCLWFRLEDEKQLVPYGYIGELFGYKYMKQRKWRWEEKVQVGES